jgi:hypothetical protein
LAVRRRGSPVALLEPVLSRLRAGTGLALSISPVRISEQQLGGGQVLLLVKKLSKRLSSLSVRGLGSMASRPPSRASHGRELISLESRT